MLRRVSWDDRVRFSAEVIGLCAAVWLVVRNAAFQGQVREQVLFVLGAALFQFSAMAFVLEIILQFSVRQKLPPQPPVLSDCAHPGGLDAMGMLAMEFEYARITASEALRDQRGVISFYLTLAGAILSVVLALFGIGVTGAAIGLPKLTIEIQPYAGATLLWALCWVGVFYLLQIIRLRQAWHDSAKTMNLIKEFYIAHVGEFSPQEFSQAFRWRQVTLPAPEKMWTISFFSAVLIALLSSLVYLGGGVLLALGVKLQSEWWPWLLAGLACLGLLLFSFILYMYLLFLKRKA